MSMGFRKRSSTTTADHGVASKRPCSRVLSLHGGKAPFASLAVPWASNKDHRAVRYRLASLNETTPNGQEECETCTAAPMARPFKKPHPRASNVTTDIKVLMVPADHVSHEPKATVGCVGQSSSLKVDLRSNKFIPMDINAGIRRGIESFPRPHKVCIITLEESKSLMAIQMDAGLAGARTSKRPPPGLPISVKTTSEDKPAEGHGSHPSRVVNESMFSID